VKSFSYELIFAVAVTLFVSVEIRILANFATTSGNSARLTFPAFTVEIAVPSELYAASMSVSAVWNCTEIAPGAPLQTISTAARTFPLLNAGASATCALLKGAGKITSVEAITDALSPNPTDTGGNTFP